MLCVELAKCNIVNKNIEFDNTIQFIQYGLSKNSPKATKLTDATMLVQ